MTVGVGAVIGAGSVITKSIPPQMMAFGVPARVVQDLTKAGVGPGDYSATVNTLTEAMAFGRQLDRKEELELARLSKSLTALQQQKKTQHQLKAAGGGHSLDVQAERAKGHEPTDFDYSISLSQGFWPAAQDTCKRGIEYIAGCRLSWWPLSESEERLKSGYTRVYSIPFTSSYRYRRHFYDDIPTPLADLLFPKLADIRTSVPKSRWVALSREAVFLRGTTLMRLILRYEDGASRQWQLHGEGETSTRGHKQDVPNDCKTSENEGIGNSLEAGRQNVSEVRWQGLTGGGGRQPGEGESQNTPKKESGERRGQPILFLSIDVGLSESVAHAVNLGENDKKTFQNLQDAYRGFPSWTWKRATGIKFYRVFIPIVYSDNQYVR